MNEYLLTIHLIGAAVLGFLVLGAVYVLVKKKTKLYSRSAIIVALGTFVQTLSGIFLSASMINKMSLLAYCGRIGFYFAILFVIELVLYKTMKDKNLKFPFRPVFNTTALAIFIAIVAY